MKTGSIFVGIIAAATAGVLVGMLIAPEKGEDIRKNIKDAVGDWTKKLGNLVVDEKKEHSNQEPLTQETEG
jgi:gas vesicle protein